MEKDKEENFTKYKLMMLGEQAVGKSSLVLRYTKNKFQYNIMGTAGLDLKKKELKINDQNLNVVIFDSAGHDRFRKISEVQFKGSDGLILVYDSTDNKSFEWILEWLDKIKANSNYKNIEILIVGNKIDLPNKVVLIGDARGRVDKYDINIIETSALTGENVENAFLTIIEKIHDKKLNGNLKNFNTNNNNNLNVNNENNEYMVMESNNKVKINLNKTGKEKKKKGCCNSQ
jgi:small GTP-binding protein